MLGGLGKAIGARIEGLHRRQTKMLEQPGLIEKGDRDRGLTPAEESAAKSTLSSLSAQSQRVDVFCTWMLALSGGSAALLLSNLDSVTSGMSHRYVSWGLYLLGVSALVGLAQKWLALEVEIAVGAGEDGEAKGKQGENDRIVNPGKIIDSVVRAFPLLVRRRLVRAMLKSFNDSLFAERSNARLTYWQIAMTRLQLVLFVVFIFLMGIGIANYKIDDRSNAESDVAISSQSPLDADVA